MDPRTTFGSAHDLAHALGATGYLTDDGLATVALPGAAHGPAAAPRGRAGHRQDRARRGARRVAGPAADPPAVLRGDRRQPGAVRLGLPAPDPAPARARGRRRAPPATSARSRTGCSTSGSSSPARCCAPCARAPAVLLVDEVDRADDEFEAFLLEVLSTWPGDDARARHGPAAVPPVVVLTSQPHPRGARRAQAPLPLPLARAPGPRARGRDRRAPRLPEVAASARRAGRRGSCTASAPTATCVKPPGVAETLDWAQALHALGAARPRPETGGGAPSGVAVKYREDADRVRAGARVGCSRDDALTLRRPAGTVEEVLVGFARALRAAGVDGDPRPGAHVPRGGRRGRSRGPAAVYWAGRATLCSGPGRPRALRRGVRGVVRGAPSGQGAPSGRPAGRARGRGLDDADDGRGRARAEPAAVAAAGERDGGAAPPRRRRPSTAASASSSRALFATLRPRAHPPARAPAVAPARRGTVDARAHAPGAAAAPGRAG